MKFWIGVASEEHVNKAVSGGFMQLCHGKALPLRQMATGDWILYYSPTKTFQGKDRCQSFTAIGHILEGEPYLFQMSQDFAPWRLNVCFLPCQKAKIHPLLTELSFIRDKKLWGIYFRRGCLEILKEDFLCIASQMGVHVED